MDIIQLEHPTQIQYFQFADIPKVNVHAEFPCHECAEYQISWILLTLAQFGTLFIMWNSNIFTDTKFLPANNNIYNRIFQLFTYIQPTYAWWQLHTELIKLISLWKSYDMVPTAIPPKTIPHAFKSLSCFFPDTSIYRHLFRSIAP